MSAVILRFPGPKLSREEGLAAETARVVSERLRVVREAIAERARNTNATSGQKFAALQAALVEVQRGSSLGGAIAVGYQALPSVRRPARVITWPTDPRPAA